MRGIGAGLGLIGLLCVVAIMLYLFAGPGPGGASYAGTLARKSKEAKQEVNQFGGRDATGKPLSQTLTLIPDEAGGSLRGLTVDTIDPKGVAATHFGLEAGDVITQIGSHEVGGFIIGSIESARDFLDTAFATNQPIQVRRDGQTISLPK